ncbi:MAG TPA: ATP-binding cassette domain-containing protein [Aliidongia sp.]|uniref:branched-chain amino acid ABC transporter ATP-binding protein/permease n=1 Tax=Aliidongia sp. TaxID=1914230 RepID=UPI002DDDA2D3|nr:ATP-binding cassette domain-containing protein [Aliidongia sp.]HEV2675600.1 ATP-binding cassette domain-containing protein [Aliidongia sp.]
MKAFVRPAPLVGLAIAGWLLVVVATGSGYEQRLMALAASSALMAIGYQLVFGQVGALSLAQGACFAIGAYAAGILGGRLGWPIWLELPAAILLPALLAAVAHGPVRRLDGHYFALATLGLAVLVRLVAVDAQGLTGGANGLIGVPPLPVGWLGLSRGAGTMLAGWTLAGIGAGLALWLKRGGNGPTLALVRDDPALARASGLDPGRIRTQGFVLAAGFAGAGGALQAHVLGLVSPDVAEFSVMVGCLAMVVIGGRGSVAGGVLGALLIGHLPEWLRPLGSSYRIAYGLGLFVCLLVAPAGLVGSLERFWPRRSMPAPLAVTTSLPRPDAVLRVDGIGKSYGGIAVLHGISLELRPGEIVGLIGPNGSGKTTLINLVGGQDRPDRGRITLGTARLDGLSADRIARAGIARSFQSVAVPDAMMPTDLVMAALAAREGRAGFGHALAIASLRGEAAALLRRVGVDSDCPLEGGSVRLVDIARALALDPAVLLLDEPAAGLDPAERDRLGTLLRALATEGRALLVVEHDMVFLMGLADRIAVLLDGRIARAGTADEVRADPRVRAAYLGEPSA